MDDQANLYDSKEDVHAGVTYMITHASKFGLKVHKGVIREDGIIPSKTKCMLVPHDRKTYAQYDLSDMFIGPDQFISFVDSFVYLGFHIHHSLSASFTITERIKAAASARGALSKVFRSKYCITHWQPKDEST